MKMLYTLALLVNVLALTTPAVITKAFNDRIKTLEDELSNKLAKFTSRLELLETKLNQQDDTTMDQTGTSEGQIPIEQPASPASVAFYTYMSKGEPTLSNHHTLIFNIAKLNKGNGYSTNTGVFTVPKTGVYMFTWTLSYFLNTQICTDIMINSHAYGNTFVQSGNTHEEATGVVIAEVNEGDEVYMRTTDLPSCPPYGQIISDDYRKSSFSGFRIG